MKIAYGINRPKKPFIEAGVDVQKIFLDTDATGGSARLDMMLAVVPGVEVLVLSMADLGRGRGQAKAINMIERNGGTVRVLETARPVEKGGRPSAVQWPSDEDLERALLIWDALPAKDALDRIERECGVKTDRNHMNYQRKKRAEAALAQGKS